ncbi:hypothetical protein NMG60_11000847 [Bertholletia excelsa]
MINCCSSDCLYKSWKVVNVMVSVVGIGMIVYSLWLLKKWIQEVGLLPPPSLPKPWFIYVSLVIGIAVCLSTLSGLMIANYVGRSILALYTLCIFCLLLIQAVVAVTIVFRINWVAKIIKYVDKNHQDVRNFLLFHLAVCRLLSASVLLAQMNVVMLASILVGVGGVPSNLTRISGPFDIRQSFLVDRNYPLLDDRRCLEDILRTYMHGIFAKSFTQIRRIQS